jgi:ligand-binding sensor domain-containing protein
MLAASLLFCCLPPATASAQLIPQRQWAVFRQADGLLSNDVYSILVTDDAIWFGTSKGVNRYDGRWRSFPSSLIEGAGSNPGRHASPGAVTALARAVSGDGIWLGTDSGYVAHWDGAEWQLVTTLAAGVHTILELDGTLWLGTEQGLYLYADGIVRTVVTFSGDAIHDLVVDNTNVFVWIGSDSGLWRLTRGLAKPEKVAVTAIDATELEPQGVTRLADVDPAFAEPVAGPIEALWSDGAGNLWLGSGAKVVQFDPQMGIGRSFEPFADEYGAPSITSITGTPGERIWIASDGGGVTQFMFADGALSAASSLGSSSKSGLDTDVVRAVVIDRDGTLWFASPVGVFRYQVWAWLDTDPRLNGLVVNDLVFDHDGGLWVATGGEGVLWRNGLYAHPTTFFSSDTGLPSEFINDLEVDYTGNIWAATPKGLATFARGEWSRPLDMALLPASTITALEADDAGLWIGTSAGLAYYRSQGAEVSAEPLFAGKRVLHMARASAGQLWVAVQDSGLWVRGLDNTWLKAQRVDPDAPPSTEVTALLPDPQAIGGMYVAFANGGVYRWTGSEWENVDRLHWTRGDRIDALAFDQPTHSLWIGSDIGLSRLDCLSLVTYDSNNGMENGAIRAIVPAPTGGYWFGGQKGLSFYRQETTPPWIRLKTINSPGMLTLTDGWQVYVGRPVQAFFVVGDTQSSPQELEVFYRLHRHGIADPWQLVESTPLVLDLEAPETVDLEVVVRDPSFNYSQPWMRRLAAVPAPSMVSLPLLGELESRVFSLLLVFGGLALIGFGYVSYEIFVHNHRVSEAVRRGFNPYISGEPVRREEMFYGRHDLLQRIVATLHNNSIMIHGERRIGKTTLLYQLAHALRQVEDEEYCFLPVLIDLEGTAEDQLFLQLAEDIYQMVLNLPDLEPAALQSLQFLISHRWSEVHPANGAAFPYTDREFGRDLRTMVRLLEQHLAQRQDYRQLRLILLLDEVDTLSQFDPLYQQQLRRIFMRDFAVTLGAVVAGIAISKEWDRVESPWFNLFNEIAMAPFSYEEAVELLVEPVRGYYSYDPAALAFIVECSEGRPYRIQQYAMEAVNHMLKHMRRRIQMSDVAYAHDQILAAHGEPATGNETGTGASAANEAKRRLGEHSASLASAARPI